MAEENQNPAAALPADLVNDINEFSVDVFNNYIANRSAEDYAKDSAKTKQFHEDEEYKNKMMQGINDAFTNADANQDGLLDENEFKAFQDKLIAEAQERGEFTDDRADVNAKWFTLSNRVNPDTNGMSLMDFFTVMGVSIAKQMELKAAHDAK